MLDQKTIYVFFDQHLPYRLGMLNTWPKHIAPSSRQHYAAGICAYEACLVAVRVFTNFLGFRFDEKTKSLKPYKTKKTDDVRIDDLGGLPCDLSLFSKPEIDALTLINKYTNKASAHLTTNMDIMGSYTSHKRDHALMLSSKALLRVIKERLHDHTNRKLIKWDRLPY